MHRDWVCHYSPALNAAFNSTFVEDQTQEYHLEVDGIDENVVHFLVHWIYSQQVDLQQLGAWEEKWKQDFVYYNALFKLYVLSNKLLISRLQNAVIEAIEAVHEKSNRLPTSFIRCTYKNTDEDSALRHYLVHVCASQNWGIDSKKWKMARATPEFILDVMHLVQTHAGQAARDKMDPRKDMSIFKVDESRGDL